MKKKTPKSKPTEAEEMHAYEDFLYTRYLQAYAFVHSGGVLDIATQGVVSTDEAAAMALGTMDAKATEAFPHPKHVVIETIFGELLHEHSEAEQKEQRLTVLPFERDNPPPSPQGAA